MADVVKGSGQWGRSTHLDRALETLTLRHRHLLTHDTVVVVVSDTKTLGMEEAERHLEQVRRSVRDIVWLNTLPRGEWPGLPSVAPFRRHCRMFECNTLAHLERIMREHLAAA